MSRFQFAMTTSGKIFMKKKEKKNNTPLRQSRDKPNNVTVTLLGLNHRYYAFVSKPINYSSSTRVNYHFKSLYYVNCLMLVKLTHY